VVLLRGAGLTRVWTRLSVEVPSRQGVIRHRRGRVGTVPLAQSRELLGLRGFRRDSSPSCPLQFVFQQVERCQRAAAAMPGCYACQLLFRAVAFHAPTFRFNKALGEDRHGLLVSNVCKVGVAFFREWHVSGDGEALLCPTKP